MAKTRIQAAVKGNLTKFMAEELAAAEGAVTAGVRETARLVKEAHRRDVLAAGLGRRVANSWRSVVYPKPPAKSLGVAAVVFTKAEKIIKGFDRGALLKSKEGFFLAIPTDAAPKRGLGGRRITPTNWPENRHGPLRFVYRRTGPSLLVVDNQRERKGKRGGFALSKSKRALKTGHGLATVVMFTLHAQARLPRKFNVKLTSQKHARTMARNIDQAFQRQKPRRRA